MDRSLREMASQLGVAHATLWRFLADKPTSERVINRLYERYCGAIAPVNATTDELPHERNARLRRDAVEGEEVQP